MTVTAEMKRAAPDPVYGCKTSECATEISYPADMLYWHPRDACFYCEHCHDVACEDSDPAWNDDDDACPSLAEVLRVPE